MGPSSLICKIKVVGITGDVLSSKTPMGWGCRSSEGGDVCMCVCGGGRVGVSLLHSLQPEERPYFLFYKSGIGIKFLFEGKVCPLSDS